MPGDVPGFPDQNALHARMVVSDELHELEARHHVGLGLDEHDTQVLPLFDQQLDRVEGRGNADGFATELAERAHQGVPHGMPRLHHQGEIVIAGTHPCKRLHNDVLENVFDDRRRALEHQRDMISKTPTYLCGHDDRTAMGYVQDGVHVFPPRPGWSALECAATDREVHHAVVTAELAFAPERCARREADAEGMPALSAAPVLSELIVVRRHVL